ncbi:TonB-dependent receptor-like protein [Nitrospirillum amazonense]|uniref:TonB-dependent receptor-like protein n=1 Tax=Nitrospirillum amazonense TaxID=28077 RepID=A0A560K303_9PROT|nr:TonB-dependent receptor [Nitrospirillum amazonense]TWB77725.1 TonB-dependent receptor-like protein [Nitrospirillum amazonense]
MQKIHAKSAPGSVLRSGRASVLAAGAAMVALMAGGQALAQSVDDLQEIVITGSRIKQANLTTASPLTTVGSQDLQYQGTTNMVDALNRLPQVTADANDNVSNGADGTSRVNLRNLGSNRNLVLIDGQRMLPPETADINFIPTAMVDRVDVVSGGASAVYGSDAVSGVVNFILRKNLDGVRADVQYSIAQHDNGNTALRSLSQAKNFTTAPSEVWDGIKKDISVAAGTNFDGKKGNVTLFAGYHYSMPVTQNKRDYSNCDLNLKDANTFICGGSSNNAYGLFYPLSGPNANTTLVNAKDGSKTWVPYNSSFAYNYTPTNYIQRTDKRETGGLAAHYEFAKEIEAYGNFMYMNDHSFSQAAPSALFQGTTFNINCNNPLMSSAQASTLCGADAGTNTDAQTFIGYRLTGPGSQPRRDDLRHIDYRFTGGFRGEVWDGWSYDANFLWSKAILNETYMNNVDNTKAQRALEVVNVNGVPTCKSVIDGTDPTCVPINVFQYNGISQAGYNYLYSPSHTHGAQTEKVGSLAINGDLEQYGIKSPWAKKGAAIALGFEHREETLLFEADQVAQANGTLPSHGSISVDEGYGELQFPIIQDKPLVEELLFNTGYRYSKYDYLDGGVSTYKFELQYAPVSDVRFRGSYNRAVRAASISELFAPTTLGNVAAVDPCSGSSPTASAAQCALTGVTSAQYGHIADCPSAVCVTQGGGNSALKPETADTFTAGVVLTPTFIPNFSATLDYYTIKVDGYISALDAQTVINQCVQTANPYFCGLFHRAKGSGVLFGTDGYIIAGNQNTGHLQTSGVDIDVSYKLALEDVVNRNWGDLDFNLTGSVLLTRETQPLPSLGTYDCTGLFGPTCGQPNPRWRHQLRTTWSSPWVPATVSVNWRFIGPTSLSSNTANDFLASDFVGINAKLPSYSYFDLAMTYKMTDYLSLRAGVNNILDRDPPAIASSLLSSFGNGNTYPGVYDPLGRTIFVGATVEF